MHGAEIGYEPAADPSSVDEVGRPGVDGRTGHDTRSGGAHATDPRSGTDFRKGTLDR